MIIFTLCTFFSFVVGSFAESSKLYTVRFRFLNGAEEISVFSPVYVILILKLYSKHKRVNVIISLDIFRRSKLT